MSLREIFKVQAGKELVSLLDVFESLPKLDVFQYLGQFDCVPAATLKAIIDYRYAYYEHEAQMVSKCNGLSFDANKVMCFETICAIAGDKKYHFGFSLIDGFDYVFTLEGEDNVYEIMVWDDSRGKEKILLFNESKRTAGFDFVPVILFVNESADAIFEMNEEGEEYLLPKGKFIIATGRISYQNQGQVRFSKYNFEGESDE